MFAMLDQMQRSKPNISKFENRKVHKATTGAIVAPVVFPIVADVVVSKRLAKKGPHQGEEVGDQVEIWTQTFVCSKRLPSFRTNLM